MRATTPHSLLIAITHHQNHIDSIITRIITRTGGDRGGANTSARHTSAGKWRAIAKILLRDRAALIAESGPVVRQGYHPHKQPAAAAEALRARAAWSSAHTTWTRSTGTTTRSSMADPDFLGLGGYASAGSSSSSEDSDSDASSVDSAQQRAAAAAARLRDYGAEQAANTSSSAPKPASGLPSAAAMFSAVGGKPAYLDPEATRPIAISSTHGLAGMGGSTAAAAAAANAGQQQGRAKKVPAADFDISQLAPKLKGQQ